MNRLQEMKNHLEYLEEQNLYRKMYEMEGAQLPITKVEGKEMLIMSSNHYLDLCHYKEIKDYAMQVGNKYGIGSGGSRLTTGNTSVHRQLEEALARFKKTEACLVFNTGYMANVGVIPAICHEGYTIFSDELNHASIIDGCRLAKAQTIIYKHNDMEDLEKKIIKSKFERGIIISDAVFSMDGDIASLPEIIQLARKYDLLTMVDEAHSTGVIGLSGRGICEYYDLYNEVDILMGTLSKAIGSEGGFVCGSKVLIEYLKNKARSFIFSTALSPFTVACSLKAIEILEENIERTQTLQDNIRYFCERLSTYGIPVLSKTAIIPIVVGDEKKTLEITQKLFEKGIYISAIRYPTVAKNEARLRITLTASHTYNQLNYVAEQISKCI